MREPPNAMIPTTRCSGSSGENRPQPGSPTIATATASLARWRRTSRAESVQLARAYHSPVHFALAAYNGENLRDEHPSGKPESAVHEAAELEAAWERARRLEAPGKIAPLE